MIGPGFCFEVPPGPQFNGKQITITIPTNASVTMIPANADVPETIYGIIRDPDASTKLRHDNNPAWALQDVCYSKDEPALYHRWMVSMCSPSLRICWCGATVTVKTPWILLLEWRVFAIEMEQQFYEKVTLALRDASEKDGQVIGAIHDTAKEAEVLPKPHPPHKVGRIDFDKVMSSHCHRRRTEGRKEGLPTLQPEPAHSVTIQERSRKLNAFEQAAVIDTVPELTTKLSTLRFINTVLVSEERPVDVPTAKFGHLNPKEIEARQALELSLVGELSAREQTLLEYYLRLTASAPPP
jgi:hypothetical protein